MTKEQFEKLDAELIRRGYEKEIGGVIVYDCRYYKRFGETTDEKGEMRPRYVIIFHVFNWHGQWKAQLRTNEDISVMPSIFVGLGYDDTHEYLLKNGKCCDIDYVESLAEKVYKFVTKNAKVNESK